MTQNIDRRGFMFVLSSPSGAGKTTLSRLLMRNDSNLVMSISSTTRAPRPKETHGSDYYFIENKEFEDKIDKKLQSNQQYRWLGFRLSIIH